jgi:ketosteroid isomerase-like protein
MRSSLPVAAALCGLFLICPIEAQRGEPLPPSLVKMIDTERAFAARALVVGWKQAFLDYFSDDAIGFDDDQVGLAKDQISKNPDPPKNLQLIWEPRYGDIASNGELGYLTGPVRNILPSRNNGQPRHSNYASVWKRQADGTYRVVMDFGVPTPGPVSYAPDFTRAPHANRFIGDYDEHTPPLGAADSVLNSALRSGPTRAYRGRMADGGRLLRPGQLPVVGEQSINTWAAGQRTYAAADTRFTESARSGDLGYSWGMYAIRPVPAARGTGAPAAGRGRSTTPEHGFYVRVWVRERNGQWKLALDVLQPQ